MTAATHDRLTPAQRAVLAVLADAAALTASEIGDRLGMSPTTAAHVARALERRQLAAFVGGLWYATEENR